MQEGVAATDGPHTTSAAPSSTSPIADLSVIIPCHNAGRWLAWALESCWRAGVPEPNVVLVDDGSTDGAVDASLRRWPRMRVLRNEEPRGVAGARQRGLLSVWTRWTLFLDQDDYLLPGAVDALRSADAFPGTAVVGDFVLDRSGSVDSNRLWFSRATAWREPVLDLLYENVQIGRWIMPTDIARQCAFRTDVGVGDDLAFVSDLATRCAVRAVPEVVLGYRVHAQQTSLQESHRLSSSQEGALRRHVLSAAARRHSRARVLARRASSALYRRGVTGPQGWRRGLILCAACAVDPTALRSGMAAKVLVLAAARSVLPPRRRRAGAA